MAYRLIIDLGVQVEVAGARYTPRQGVAGVTGRIWQYRMYVGIASPANRRQVGSKVVALEVLEALESIG